MKKVVTTRNKFNLSRFTLLDVIFLVLIFSLLSITITVFIFKRAVKLNDSSEIDKVYNQIINNYYEDINKDELANSAIDGMMKYLGDKYSIYMDNDKTSALNEELDGKYKGIGVVVQLTSSGLYIVDVLADSPAEKGGLKKNDQILQLDDYVIDPNKDIHEPIEYIQSHNEIAFLIKRNDSEVLINIISTDVDKPVVTSKLLSNGDDNYGYIYLETFSSAAYSQFKKELNELEKNNIKGLIIDFRDNLGGYLEQAVEISSMFVKRGKVLYSLKDKNESVIYYDETDESRNYPIVIITNNNTASSSELVALALKENNGALIVGTTTFGKGKVQQTQGLGNNSMIKYTTAKWYSPNNNCIDEVGIRPNYIVELSEKFYKNPIDKNDNQLTKALSVLIDLNK